MPLVGASVSQLQIFEDEIVERLRLRGAFKDFSFAKLAMFPDIS